MYGAIIGDIAGSAFEFHATKKKDFVWFPQASRFTDDTVMTVAVADALLALRGREGIAADGSGLIYEDEIRETLTSSLRRWGRRYPDAGYGGRFFTWLLAPYAVPYGSYGNGSAMRVSPAGWLYDDMQTTRLMARLTAVITHDHPEGIKGAEAVAAAIFMARNGEHKCSIKNYIETEFGYDLNRTLKEIRPAYRFDMSCQGSVPEAIRAFLEGDDRLPAEERYEDVVRNAVSLGGDADTQGSIAGSIAEAFYGVPDPLTEHAREKLDVDICAVVDRFYDAVRM